MITKFDSSYYGTADMKNLGYAGTPINERCYPKEELAQALHKAVAYAKCMDERGYNTFWMAEHHFQPEGTELIPNLLMMAMHLVNVTKNLKIGCGFNVVPMWHPLRLAEDYAMADVLSGGRVIFGVARGYHTREVETFGSPLLDQDANREIFEEGVDILFKAFEGKPFSHQGKYYTIPPQVPYRGYTLKQITLVPAPEHLPVECWQPIQSGSERAFDFMAKHGISGVIGGGSAEGGAVERHMLGFQAAYARRGVKLELGEKLALGFQFHIAKNREEGMREAAKHYEENMKMFGELRLVRALSDEQIAAMRDPRARRHRQAAAHRGCGEGRRLPDRHARGHHRATEGGREALSRHRPGDLRDAARHPARGPARRSRPLRQGGHAGVPRDPDGRRSAIDRQIGRAAPPATSRSRIRQSEDGAGRGDAAQPVFAERQQRSVVSAASAPEISTHRPSGRHSPSSRLTRLTAGPMAVKSSRSAAPILPHNISPRWSAAPKGSGGSPCPRRPASRWAMPARAATTARSAASQAAAGAPLTGKIASTPSPMNLRTSPPKACTAPAMRSNQASRAAIITAGCVASDSAVKSRRSAESSAARMVSPVPRLSAPACTRAALRRPR